MLSPQWCAAEYLDACHTAVAAQTRICRAEDRA